MKGVYRVLTFLIFIASGIIVRSQIDFRNAQYYRVPVFYNPGATGCSDGINVIGYGSMEYVGMDNSPRRLLLSADTPFKVMDRGKGGAGIKFSTYRFGPFSGISAGASLSFSFRVGKGNLSLGLQPSFLRQRFKDSSVNDGSLVSNDNLMADYSKFAGDRFTASVGAWYSHGALWFGLSICDIFSHTGSLKWQPDDGEDSMIYYPAGRSVYFMAGYNFLLKNTMFEIVPSVIYCNTGSNNRADITLRGIWKKMLTIGLGYGWEETVSLILAAEYKGVYLGYNYDCQLNGVRKEYKGSHGILAGYRVKLDWNSHNTYRQRNIRLM